MRTSSRAAERLAELNRQLDEGRVAAFTVYPDEEGEDVADVLFVLPDPPEETWPLETQDAYCALASDALEDVVKFAYCTFLAESEQEEFPLDGWERVPAGPGGG
jgi:hypothetical protein